MIRNILLSLLVLCALTQAASAAEPNFSDRKANLAQLSGLRVGYGAGTVRIVLDLTRQVDFKESYVENPSRMIVDLQNTWLSPGVNREIELKSTVGKRIRIAQFDPSTVRVVIESMAATKLFYLPGGKSGQRLIIDLGSADFKEEPELNKTDADRERERQAQLERDRQAQPERQAQLERERELQAQREIERQAQQERELEAQRERELESQRDREYQAQLEHERELQARQERERQAQLERERQLEQRERELEQREQAQRERELQAQRERQLEAQRLERERLEKEQLEREKELEKRERELEKREKEQREKELKEQRERDIREQREREKEIMEREKREKKERERLEKEQREREKKERKERERQEKEQREKDKRDGKDHSDDGKDSQADEPLDELDYDLNTLTALKDRKIVIDPGHGGNDAGAIGPTGVMEKNVTLKVALELKRLLEAEGAQVILTRTGDTTVSAKGAKASDIEELGARCDVANRNGADIFISIHADSFTRPEARGTTGYYYSKGSGRGQQLADCIRRNLVEQLGTPSRGTQPCNFFVVKNTDMPATLIELGFISNKEEEQLLDSEDGVKRAAQGILDGIEDYFG